MSLSLSGYLRRTSSSWTLLQYAAGWTMFLVLTVAMASLPPEMAFLSATSPSSSFSNKCKIDGSIRMPLDIPGSILCFPAPLFQKSKFDFIVPPILAVVFVTASTCLVRALGLWDHHQAS
ncbi:hypothetical protein QN277_023167 [Acacia crassicarpa]|uniref:Uncharacterized protein n=1 Tax=Acacia crassicarpa TaxID=499986 RepID=A0AAE1MMQ6_9FABA|nr:hypothetical protein QN277_023167 [Acacia crassicarpa]